MQNETKRRSQKNPTARSTDSENKLTPCCEELPPIKHQKTASQETDRIENIKPILRNNTAAAPTNVVKYYELVITGVSAHRADSSDKIVGHLMGIKHGGGGGVLQ